MSVQRTLKDHQPFPECASDQPVVSNVRDLGDHVIEYSAGAGDPVVIDGRSMLFDPDWYRMSYGTAANLDNPVQHYIEMGWRIGCDPNAFFSTEDYLRSNPDAGATGLNPFVHYVLYGACQGRRPRAAG